jgi:spore maturation protein CgeB
MQSKINLNIPNSTGYDFRFMFSSIKAFASCIRSSVFDIGKNSSQTKARNFEIPMHGGFQLTDYVPTLEEYFIIGKEVACYNSIDELFKLVEHYLHNDDERETIKKAGIERARADHCYQNRITEFMAIISEINVKNK